MKNRVYYKEIKTDQVASNQMRKMSLFNLSKKTINLQFHQGKNIEHLNYNIQKNLNNLRIKVIRRKVKKKKKRVRMDKKRKRKMKILMKMKNLIILIIVIKSE